MKFYCNAAREIITPPLGCLLAGYRPDLDARHIADDLTVTVFIFSNGAEKFALISAAVLDIRKDLDDLLRGEVAKKIGTTSDHIIFHCIHNHSGPNMKGSAGWGEADMDYFNDIFMAGVLNASEKANIDLIEAEMAISKGESLIGINRREIIDGKVSLGQNKEGLFDPEMVIVSFRNALTKAPIFNLIHYGCHGTACGQSHIISRDWAGYMIDSVEARTGVLTAFFNGAIGDVGPRISNGKTIGVKDLDDLCSVEENMRYAAELGEVASADALRIISEEKLYSVPDIELFKGVVSLPRQALPEDEEIKYWLDQYTEPEKLINIAKLRYTYFSACKALKDKGETKTPEDFSYEEIAFRIGDLIIIATPFELFSKTVLAIKEKSPVKNTLVLSCANGYSSYLPLKEDMPFGGYEVNAFRFQAPFGLSVDSADIIVDKIISLLFLKEK